MITFKLNGKEVQGKKGQYILQVARENGIEIPTLCHHEALEPAGMCRLCTVELFDGRKSRFVTACNYPIWEGMEVFTDSEKVHSGRKLIVEMLLSRCPEVPVIKDLALKYGITETRFELENDDCILCGLCVRICERMGNSALSLAGRGTEYEGGHPFSSSVGCVYGLRGMRLRLPDGTYPARRDFRPAVSKDSIRIRYGTERTKTDLRTLRPGHSQHPCHRQELLHPL